VNIRDMAYSLYDSRYSDYVVFNKIQYSDPMKSSLYTMTREEFADQMVEANRKRWESGEAQAKFLYNGSGTRAQLSKAEIIALANKYDVRNMDDNAYDDLLDDLESMGAISHVEKLQLGYHNCICAYFPDENGDLPDTMKVNTWVSPTDKALLFDRQDATGDLFCWINDRVQWTAGGSTTQLAVIRRERAFEVLANIINRMHVERSRSVLLQGEETL